MKSHNRFHRQRIRALGCESLETRQMLSGGGVPAPAGLISWWPAEGTADDIADTNHGTLVNGVTFAQGMVGQTFSFDGSDDHVRVPDASNLEPTRVTVEGWVRGTSPGTFRYLVTKGAPDAGGSPYALYTGATGGLSFVVHNSTPAPTDNVQSPVANASIWDGNWHHVAGTYDLTSVRLFVDGAEIGTGTASTHDINYNVTGTQDLLLGNFVDLPGSYGFSGQIDEMSVYDRALDATEIQAVYNAGSAGKCDDPDIQVDSLTGDGATTLTATYTITNFSAQPFDLGFYQSTDASLDAGDQTLATVTISDPADLTVGQHVKTWTIGGGVGQIPLPGAGVAENDLEYHLIAVADPIDALVEDDADPTNEDNTAAFTGAYRLPNGSAYLHGGSGNSAVNVGLAGANTLVVTLDGTDYSIPGGRNASVPSVRVRTHAGADVLSTTFPDKTVFYLGGAGADTLLGPDLNRNWILNGLNAGRSSLTTFASVENLVGGSATDNFRFSNGFGVTGLITGGGGVNTLDYTLYKTQVTVNLGLGTATSVGGGVTNIANVFGGDASDVLVGDNGPNYLKGSSGADSLTGGLGDDTFDGGSGLDCLVETADVDLTLAASTLAGLGSDTLVSIERALLTGGAGDNVIDASAFTGNAILRGMGGADELWGGLGRDLLFGGDGADTFHGGAAEDIVLSGTTVHDANDAALLAVLAEWNSTRSFFTRISNIRGNGSGPRINGTTLLTPGVTAFDSHSGDSLAGGADLDWYFIALGDSLTDISTGELVDIL